jgi:hypothetical protein
LGRPRSVHVYAGPQDLREGTARAEERLRLKYVDTGLFAAPTYREFETALAIPNLGYCPAGRRAMENAFMILDAQATIGVREVPQRRGGVLYAVDEVANPSAAIFYPGGLSGENCLVVSEFMGTSDPRSLALYRVYIRELLRGFFRIKQYYVGPEAKSLLERGFRLTHEAHFPCEHDLKV